MTARIYRPAKTAMQSGNAKTKEWVLDYEPEQPREVEPLMGWTSSADMKQEVRLQFDTKDEAMAYCERQGIAYQVFELAAGHAAAQDRLFRQFRLSAPRRLDALTDQGDVPARRLQATRAGAACFWPPARWRSSEMKRSSGIGWPSRKP